MQSNVVGALPWQECAIEPGCFATIQTFFGQQSKTRGFPDRPSAKNKIMELKPRGMDLRPDPPGLFISPGIAGGIDLWLQDET